MYLFDNNLNKISGKLFKSFLGRIPSWITPSIITWSGFVVAVISLYYFSFLDNNWIWFIIFSFVTLLFDALDGILARFRNVLSFKGKVEDALADNFINTLFIVCLSQFSEISLFWIASFGLVYGLKMLFVVLDSDREIGGGRVSFLISVFFAVSYFGFESIAYLLPLFLFWNVLSIFSGVVKYLKR